MVGMFPSSAIVYLKNIIPKLKKGTMLIDLVGVKTSLIDELDDLCVEYGVNFIGGHPMAGKAIAGYTNSTPELYNDASMILVPTKSTVEKTIPMAKEFFLKLGFGRVIVCTKETHDSMIAYTSQLAHVVSSAFIKSPNAKNHKGYSAGSYKDMTRIACLNENVWTELFLYNSNALVEEIDILVKNMMNIRNSIAQKDEDALKTLLKQGRLLKEEIDL